MNQTLSEHHIAQYSILLIEDQTVNQTKHAWQLGNIAIVFVSHVFLMINSIYFSHGRQYKIAPWRIEHHICRTEPNS